MLLKIYLKLNSVYMFFICFNKYNKLNKINVAIIFILRFKNNHDYKLNRKKNIKRITTKNLSSNLFKFSSFICVMDN